MAPIIKKKPATPTSAPVLAVAGLRPDQMIQAGLMDDFDGLVQKARFVPFDYNGTIDPPVLGVQLTIKPDDGDAFEQTYSAGDLNNFVPSMDGIHPCDLDSEDAEDHEGIYALRVGKKDGLNNNSNFAQFQTALIESGFDPDQLQPNVDSLEGLYGHWNRIPQKKRSGIQQAAPEEGQKARNKDVLVITEIKDAPAATGKKTAPSAKPVAAKSSPVGKKAPAPVEPEEDTDTTEEVEETELSPLDTALRVIVTKAVTAAGDDGIEKAKLVPLALKGLSGPDKAKGVKRVASDEFLSDESAPWLYDAESGTLFAAPEAE